MLVGEIEDLQESIPSIRENMQRRFQQIKEKILQLSDQIESLRGQSDVISRLKTAVAAVSSNKHSPQEAREKEPSEKKAQKKEKKI